MHTCLNEFLFLDPVKSWAFIGQNNPRYQSLLQQHFIECGPQLISDVIMSIGVQSVHVHTSLEKLNLDIFNFLSAAILLFLENSQNPVVHRQSTEHRFFGVEAIWCIATLKRKKVFFEQLTNEDFQFFEIRAYPCCWITAC